MKLRIKGNTIRLRLLRSEVERFVTDGRISETTSFGGTALLYSLVISGNSEKVYAEFEDKEIRVFIPEDRARNWATSDEVGLGTEQPVGEGDLLTILVEKDFVCVGRPDDPDREDAFPANK